MKVIVCGGRDYHDRDAVFAALDKAHEKRSFSMVVHDDRGAGLLAGVWAQEHGVLSARLFSGKVFAADPGGVIAFPGAPVSFLDDARDAGVKVWCPYGE